MLCNQGPFWQQFIRASSLAYIVVHKVKKKPVSAKKYGGNPFTVGIFHEGGQFVVFFCGIFVLP